MNPIYHRNSGPLLFHGQTTFTTAPHKSLKERISFETRYGLSESYERLIPFGCEGDRYIHKHQRGKLDNATSTGIMVGNNENSTELRILC